MPSFFDVFISYGRVDSKAFAARLNQHLSAAGLNVWLDLEDIPPGVDYQKEIDDSIDRAHNFIFILSPHAVNSEYCRLEIEQALRRKKRIIPLLHLEQIDQQTWKQRYPEGSEADWQAYQTAGKHSSYNNLLPAIRKLNWVPCREGVDDLDAALQGLLALCRRHTTYVAQHTQLLCQALTWKQQQKRNRYLLVGEERLQAEAWLGTRFRDEQPPCSPTDLHCEFITESTKNANNLMTQVFLAHAETDTATMEQIRRSLWREGITVWTSTTDIRTGEDLLQAVERGIEQADNVVYLLSPASQGSQYCQYELDYALALNKRVIPVLVSPTPDEQIPPSLRGLQYVDLTDNLQLEDYWLDESQLLRILAEDAVYHEHHKVLLTQALKWSRQNRNPAMLLRGYNLRHAENWIKAARSQAQPPVELHETFITESLRQPPGVPLDVFISYSRVDSDFARRLNEALQMEGKRTWFDQESIASGVDFQQEIYRGIETSDVFLFILSPQSIASPYCAAEVEYADRLNKRIVTALCRPINADDLHPVLAKVQWVNFRVHEGDFQTNLQQLLRALETDQQHLEMHTRLLVKAVEWDQRDRDESLLLRGRELEMAEHWLVNNAALDPRPADLHKQYVTTSRTHQTLAQQVAERRLRQGMLAGLAAAALGMIFALGSIWFAQNQQKRVEDILREAAQEVEAANAKVIEAKSQEGVALSREKAALERAGVADWTRQAAEKLAQTAQAAANQAAAAQRAAQAQTQTAVKQAEAADAQAKDALRRGQTADKNARDAAQRAETAARSAQAARVAAEAAHKAAQIAQKQRTLATEGTRLERNGTLALRLGETGKASGFLKVLEVGYRLERLVEDNPDAIAAENILTYPAASPILALQTLLGRTEGSRLYAHKSPINSAQFSPDGQWVVTASADSTARVWNLISGEYITLHGHQNRVNSAQFSPDGKQVVTASADGTARVWNLTSGEYTVLQGHQNRVNSAQFSPDGQRVLTISGEGAARVWEVKAENFQLLQIEGEQIGSGQFSPDGQQVVTANVNGKVYLWQLPSGQSRLLGDLEGNISAAEFSPNGRQLVTATSGGQVRLWELSTGRFRQLENRPGRVNAASFSPDGQQLAIAYQDGAAELWHLPSGRSALLLGHEQRLNSVVFSADGQRLVTASQDGTAQVWDVATGQSLKVLKGHEGAVYSAQFSLNGQRVVTASVDGMARVWDLGEPTASLLKRYPAGVADAHFSPNGQQVAIAGANGTVELISLATRQSSTLTGHQGRVNNLQFSPNGQQLVTAGADQSARLWDLRSGRSTRLEGFQGNVTQVSFSADGRQVVTVAAENQVQLWDAATGRLLRVLEGHQGQVTSAQLSPDGRYLVITSKDPTARLWNLKTGQFQALEGHTDWVISAEFSGDSQRLITTSQDGTARLWDLGTGQAQILAGHRDWVNSAHFSPDGQRLVTASRDGTARLWAWSRDTGRVEVVTLSGHENAVNSAVFSRSGQQVVTASDDGTVRVWDLAGREIYLFEGHRGKVASAEFNPSGDLIVTASDDGTVRLWALEGLPQLLDRGCEWLRYYLLFHDSVTNVDREICGVSSKTTVNGADPAAATQGATLGDEVPANSNLLLNRSGKGPRGR